MKIESKKALRKYLSLTVLLGILVFSFVVTIICFISADKTVRREFLFPSADGDTLVVEYRNLPKESEKNQIQIFVDDLLLGSSVERTKLLFAQGTKTLSCFERNGTLYVNLSPDLLFVNSGTVSLEEGADLFEKNVKLNFPKVEKIELYVDGNLAFEKKSVDKTMYILDNN